MSCDIIIPVWNQFKLTENCVRSIKESTRYPYRLIIVDNGSDKETAQYLESLRNAGDLDLTLLRNESNLGFIKAVNQGIENSRASYICLLNNDTQVFAGWLNEMINIAENNPQIGIVNPSSNTLGQKSFKNKSLENYVSELTKKSGNWEELASCTGFCMLIKRDLIIKLGMLDEAYGMGNFEDTDLSFKAKSLGYKCVRAKGAYVLHKEKKSFIKLKGRDRAFKENLKIFSQKWGTTQRVLYIITKFDNDYYRAIEKDSLELAHKGSWVTVFKKKSLDNVDISKHSNINVFNINERNFYLTCLWRILKKKKKFNIIYSDNLRVDNCLNKLKLIHKAELKNRW